MQSALIKDNKITIHSSRARQGREKLAMWLLKAAAPLHLWFCRKRQPWSLCTEELLAHPPHSLGREMALFYSRHNIRPLARAERHDACHVLLGYDTSVRQEALMQFFLLGNGKRSLFSLSSAVLSALLFPGCWCGFYRQFKRGRRCRQLSAIDFKALLYHDLEALRAALNIEA